MKGPLFVVLGPAARRATRALRTMAAMVSGDNKEKTIWNLLPRPKLLPEDGGFRTDRKNDRLALTIPPFFGSGQCRICGTELLAYGFFRTGGPALTQG